MCYNSTFINSLSELKNNQLIKDVYDVNRFVYHVITKNIHMRKHDSEIVGKFPSWVYVIFYLPPKTFDMF